MSEYGLFFDSRNGDRKYNAASMEEFIKPFFSNGTWGGDLVVTATSGMTVNVAAGYCNINGKVMRFEQDTTFTLAVAGAQANRVDTIVVERNDTDREFTLKAITGADGGGATPPVRTSAVYQIVLAQIAVDAGVTGIAQEDITDTRSDSDLCGIVSGTGFEELSAEFQSWFDHFRSNITGDAAGQLQGEIDLLDQYKANGETWDSVTLAAANWAVDAQTGTYVYSLETVYPNASYDITDVLPNSSTTSAMRSAWIAADCGGHEETNIIRSYGYVPTIDLVMGVCVRSKSEVLMNS